MVVWQRWHGIVATSDVDDGFHGCRTRGHRQVDKFGFRSVVHGMGIDLKRRKTTRSLMHSKGRNERIDEFGHCQTIVDGVVDHRLDLLMITVMGCWALLQSSTPRIQCFTLVQELVEREGDRCLQTPLWTVKRIDRSQ